ncbi:apolipoprotein D [Fopius arisanus]|uniref:Apolipoprotein D n=2 Tax=Fopius arisanus TaxID=64838 RepID=A0A9R1TET1_9HYME|nr:PREDICTED: apolipoprotein D-like [Fopius arisanus]
MVMLLIVCLLGLFAQSSAQIRRQGSCPQPKSIPNFNETKLIGQWFEWARIDNAYQPDHVCGLTTYYRNNDGVLIKAMSSILRFPGTRLFWEGKMVPRESTPTARYHMVFPDWSLETGLISTYVAANWDHWVILHGCKQQGNQSLQFAWVWVKNPNLDGIYQRQISRVLEEINLPMRNLRGINQTNCPNHRSAGVCK